MPDEEETFGESVDVADEVETDPAELKKLAKKEERR